MAEDATGLGLFGPLVRQSGLYWVGQIVPAGLALLGLAVYTRLLTTEDYGIYVVVLTVATLGLYVSHLWLCAAALRLLEAIPGPVALRANLFVIYAGIVLFGGGGALGFHLVFNERYVDWLILGFGLFVTMTWLELQLHLLNAEVRAGAYACVSISRGVLALLTGTTLAWMGWGAGGVLLGAVIGHLLPGLWLAWVDREGFSPGGIDRRILRQLLVFGLPLIPGLALEGLLYRLDRILLGGLSGAAVAGVYAAAFDLADRTLRPLLSPIGSAGLALATRRLEREGDEAMRRQLESNAVLLVAIALPAAVGFVLIAPSLCANVLGAAFRDEAGPIARLVALATVLAMVRASYVDHAFHLGRRTWLYSMAALVTAGTSLALNLLLIPSHGALGAAWAALGARFTGLVVALPLARQACALPLPVAEFAKTALATATMALVVQPLAGDQSPTGLAAAVSVGIASYGVAALAFNVGQARTRLLRLLGGHGHAP